MMSNTLAVLNRRLPSKRAFITGSGSGLGLELARLLAREGWSLGLFDIDAERLTQIESELAASGAPVHAFPGDVSHRDEFTVAVNAFVGNVGGLDLMINNAGVGCAGGLLETSLEDWRWIIETNVLGVVNGCRAGVPHLQLSKGGILLNISSAAAFIAPPFLTPYNATKAAIVALSESLAGELENSGVQVSIALPGFIQTQLLSTARGPDRERKIAEHLMEGSGYSAAAAAQDILLGAARGNLYIVLPKAMRSVWRMKRWWPQWFTRKFPHLRESFTHKNSSTN
jgi:NAD(P)-dependent dehydrogenase (short-subunit alcohol dehydrogenase family)